MIKTLWAQIKKISPPLVLCCILAVLFSGGSIICVATDLGTAIPLALIYVIYVCAAISLALAVWAIVLFCRHLSPRRRFIALAHRNVLTARIVNDYSFRTVVFTYTSFALNISFAMAKGLAGLLSYSWWLISLSAYYLVLCISKLLLLRSSHKLAGLESPCLRKQKEWKTYRICGILFLVMTLVLMGIVALIISEGNEFTYDDTLIFVVAMYDFYCLTASIVYMIRTRKQHTPIIVAIKTIGLASALVSMLSLQTAMFAAFGTQADIAFKERMNLISGAACCVLLFLIGIAMIMKSNRKIKIIKNEELRL